MLAMERLQRSSVQSQSSDTTQCDDEDNQRWHTNLRNNVTSNTLLFHSTFFDIIPRFVCTSGVQSLRMSNFAWQDVRHHLLQGKPLKACKKSRAGFSILPKVKSTDLVGIPGASLVLVFLETTHIPLPLAILPCAGLNGRPV